ncbi:MAG: hypothetical protein AB7Q97_12425 [Gammaproteobacteria bacterium]
MTPGTIYNIPPEPSDPARTTLIDAGVLRFGVEPRQINRESLRASYAGDPVALARFEALVADGRDIADGGVSIHVFGAADGHEYLRFDCFDDEPHYHYHHRTGQGEVVVNHWVPFDRVACGEMLPWAIATLRARLPEMLTKARGAHLTDRIDAAAVERALIRVEELARSAPSR